MKKVKYNLQETKTTLDTYVEPIKFATSYSANIPYDYVYNTTEETSL